MAKNMVSTFGRWFVLAVLALAISSNAVRAQELIGLQAADNGVPGIVKGMPDWENAGQRTAIVEESSGLQKATGKRPILDAVPFTGGTTAATAAYDQARLVVIEYNTPQLALEADAAINVKLEQLKANGDNLPSGYRKVGNYAVFVFDAADERAANALMDRVAYEKTVQWLGDDPYAIMRAERVYAMTMGDVILTVVRASGYALLAALVFGGLAGALVFYWRRRDQAVDGVFSDAGGMMRLNLDDYATAQKMLPGSKE